MLSTMKSILSIAIFVGFLSYAACQPLPLADPFILLHNNTYYAYGTHADNGIEVYTSDDLKHWKYSGLALKKGDVW